MSTLCLCLALAALPGAPRTVMLTPEAGVVQPVLAASVDVPPSLVEARKLSDQLRYEEAVVEYQRYLALVDRPARERAQALLEVGFIHLVLGDDTNAQSRALEALELEPTLQAPQSAPAKQALFVEKMRQLYLSRARVQLEPRRPDDAPNVVRVAVADPDNRVRRVLLRHGLAATGPYYATQMRCEAGACDGAIPPPKDASSFTAYYYVEALGDAEATEAKVASPDAPLQLSVANQKPWYTSPVVWGITGAALVGIGAVVYALSPQPPR